MGGAALSFSGMSVMSASVVTGACGIQHIQPPQPTYRKNGLLALQEAVDFCPAGHLQDSLTELRGRSDPQVFDVLRQASRASPTCARAPAVSAGAAGGALSPIGWLTTAGSGGWSDERRWGGSTASIRSTVVNTDATRVPARGSYVRPMLNLTSSEVKGSPFVPAGILTGRPGSRGTDGQRARSRRASRSCSC
jgi:hypothetical protein